MIKGEECATKFNRSFLAKILYANGALETKNFDIALEELRKAEILAGDNKEFITQVLTMRADVYYRMKDFIRAFETFEAAIKKNGDDLTVINNYAYYLAEQNSNLKEAEEMARKVIETEKNNSTYLDTYAWVLYKRGKFKEAAKIMASVTKEKEQTLELSEKDVINVLEIIMNEYPVDRSRMYLTGHSMGSGGTWYLGAKYNLYWSAIAPMSGPFVEKDLYPWDRIRNMPVFMTEGTGATPSLEGSRQMSSWMKEQGFKLEYMEVDADHGGMVPLVLPAVFDFFNRHATE